MHAWPGIGDFALGGGVLSTTSLSVRVSCHALHPVMCPATGQALQAEEILTWTLARVLGDSCGLIRRYSMLNQLGAPCRAQHSTETAAACQDTPMQAIEFKLQSQAARLHSITSCKQQQSQAAHARQTSTHSSPAPGSVSAAQGMRCTPRPAHGHRSAGVSAAHATRHNTHTVSSTQ